MSLVVDAGSRQETLIGLPSADIRVSNLERRKSLLGRLQACLIQGMRPYIWARLRLRWHVGVAVTSD